YAVFAGLTIHLHFLFATTWIVHAIAFAAWRDRRATPAQAAAAVALGAVIVAPAGPGLLALFAPRMMIVNRPNPWMGDFFAALDAPVLFLAGVGAVIGARVLGRDAVERAAPIARAALVLLIAWHVVPWLLLYSVTKLTTTRIFMVRYALCGAPG